MLRETDAVSYYTTFDNFKVGVQQGTSLLTGLEASGTKAPWNVELFAGSADDNNAKFFFEGAMSVLQPKITDGTVPRSFAAEDMKAETSEVVPTMLHDPSVVKAALRRSPSVPRSSASNSAWRRLGKVELGAREGKGGTTPRYLA